MKRSRTASLILMGGAPLLLTACSHEPDAVRSGLYTSVDACVAAGNDATACSDAYVKAAQEAKTDAPAFSTARECEARYGELTCVERTVGGHGYFMPMMAGFMLAQAMRGNTATGAFRSAAAFRDNANGWHQAPWQNQGPPNQNPPAGGGYGSGGGYAGGFRSGSGRALETVTSAPDRAVTTVGRGGFGSGGAARGMGFHGFGG